MPGVSSRTDRWNRRQTTTKPTTHGKQNGSACDATGPSLLTILCCSNCQKDRPANNTALDASLSTWPGRNEDGFARPVRATCTSASPNKSQTNATDPRQQPRPTHGQPRLQHPDFSSHQTPGTTEGHQTAPQAQPTAGSMFHCSWQPQAGSRHTLCNNGQITLQQVTFGSVSSPRCNEPIPSHGSNFTTS